ncbi:MAG: four helix bundle protein [Candidatus Micrarchaeia archaeon]
MKKLTNEKFKKQLIRRVFNLARRIIVLVDKFPNKRSAWVITDQLLRAGTLIGSNVIEAQSASSKKDFINFLNHALKSANESKFWLALSKELDNNLIFEINEILKETDELAKILGASITSLKGKNKL